MHKMPQKTPATGSTMCITIHHASKPLSAVRALVCVAIGGRVVGGGEGAAITDPVRPVAVATIVVSPEQLEEFPDALLAAAAAAAE